VTLPARKPRSNGRRVLIVDDEADIRELLDLTVARMGLTADCAATLEEARRLLGEHDYQLCLTDMRLPDGEGLQLVRYIADTCEDLPVAVITAHGSMENAVSALKAGAFDYLSKPVSLEQLRALVKSALELPSVGERKAYRASRSLLGESQAMRDVRILIERVARSQAPVHATGESGSGKELAARLIHQLGARKVGPFVPVNCGAIPEHLMESEFFGYRKGAFTGAESDREGFFQAANGGTLFLDEVADLPLIMQVKLLRAIQEKRVRKVGATAEESADVRIVCATHKNLRELVEKGKFRQDLYYRLNVLEIRMPSLRERRDDVPILAQAILENMANSVGRPVPKLAPSAIDTLCAYPFPGNVRELENILERAFALSDEGVIEVSDLQLVPVDISASDGQVGTLDDHLNQVERKLILDALERTRNNRTAAARLLGVTFRSLRYRMERLGLNE
jgi:two-component system, NtrC family, response regulator PilR